MTLAWKGEELIRKIRKAQIAGVNQTMADAVEQAKRHHAWHNRTGTLEGSIKIAEYAHRYGKGVSGTWGSSDVVYALIHELGGRIVPKNAPALVFQIDGRTVVTQKVKIPARPYLRPAADAKYPGLVGNIRRALKAAA